MIAAVVFGRAESQPFPGRNTFPLLGRPLMAYPILAAKHAKSVDKIYLSTDDPGMTRIGQHFGADIIDRPPALRGFDTPIKDIISQGYQEVARREKQAPDILVILLANAPTVTNAMIEQGVEMLRTRPDLDAVMTVSLQKAFHPSFALKLKESGLLESYLPDNKAQNGESYYPTALLWILRASCFKDGVLETAPPHEIVDVHQRKTAPILHEGYGDVDYPWQIPAVEEWMHRSGFSETATPYDVRPSKDGEAASWRKELRSTRDAKKRVLITTVPFAQMDPRPLELLKKSKVDYFINPIGRRLKEEELIDMIPHFGLVVAGTEPITDKVIAAGSHLQLISRVGIGLDNVDLGAARGRGVKVTYTPDAPAPAVAELTVGLMLSVLRHICVADRQMRSGVWYRSSGRRLSEMTVGVIGAGRIGQKVIGHLLGGFSGVKILACDVAPDKSKFPKGAVAWADQETVLRNSDVVTVHVPLMPSTENMITRRDLKKMKPDSVFINTSRGGIVNEKDLAEALRNQTIAGAAVDVFTREPYSGELCTLSNCVLTCHMGSMSRDCRARMEIEAVEEVIRFLDGKPLERLVPEAEYELAGKKGAL